MALSQLILQKFSCLRKWTEVKKINTNNASREQILIAYQYTAWRKFLLLLLHLNSLWLHKHCTVPPAMTHRADYSLTQLGPASGDAMDAFSGQSYRRRKGAKQ